MAPAGVDQIQVLHLLGSPTSKFYFDLSIMYGRTCAEFNGLNQKDFKHMYAVVYSSGKWGFPSKLDDAKVMEAEKEALSVGAALAKIEGMQPAIDVVVPHMFCLEGMTRYRALCDMLQIEVLGCSPETCHVGQDKFLTKAVCEVAGVPVAKGMLLRNEIHGANVQAAAQEVLQKHSAPFIVKASREDNSIGLSLVKTNSVDEVSAAIKKAFEYDDHILVEEFIAGRECRVAVLEVEEGNDLKLVVLPKLEYIVDDIREQKHKLGTDSNGRLLTGDKNVSGALEKAKQEGERICPAQFEPEVHARLDDLAKKAHVALGCKYYSLYDVRIDRNGFPYMLEACLFCSFSPYSVVVTLASKMSDSELQPHPKVFESLLRRAAAETQARRAVRTSGDVKVTGGVKRRKIAQ
jgi:D-alanine-D-alanine ligase